MIKVGVVVQRYGKEVLGGAETLARNISERLNRYGFDVTVYTTTAKDYMSWRNAYPAGTSILKGVVIKRYMVNQERDMDQFNKDSTFFFNSDPRTRDEACWIRQQGPYTPDLIQALRKDQKDFDVFIFFTYLYYSTIEGLKVINKPVILFPTAHDELPIYMQSMKAVFNKPRALFFLTQAEMDFVKNQFAPKNRLILIRTGIDLSKSQLGLKEFQNKYRLFYPYILYAGRIEKGKGLELVFKAFAQICKNRLVDLVLIGKKLMDLPKMERLRYLGFIEENDKLMAFKQALMTIQPSELESLSITTLESFAQKTPVLVNKKCRVLMEHVQLSGGGFAFDNIDEFLHHFYHLYDNKKTRQHMGLNGFIYVKNKYSWGIVMEKIIAHVNKLVSATR